MLFDYQNMFSDDQAVTVSAVADAVMDMGARPSDVPNPNEKGVMKLHCQTTEDFAAAGAATLQVKVQTSDSITGVAGSEVLSAAEDIALSPAIPVASLVAGYEFGLPCETKKYKRYVSLSYVVATGPFTAGKITAGFVHDRQTNG